MSEPRTQRPPAGDDDNEVKILAPSYALKDKAPPGERDLSEVLAEAEGALEGMVDGYLEWAREDLARLDAACRALESGAEPARAIETLHLLAHDMKGQGGTFGYALVSVIGDSLCKLLAGRQALDPAGIEAARLHVDALRSVLAKRIRGDGGGAGAELAEGLAKLVAKVSG